MEYPSLEQIRNAMNELNFEVSEDQLIIALDFGTTFSGIAYAFTNAEKPDLVSITDWPGAEGRKQPKIPTIISYDPKNKQSFNWGAQQSSYDKIEAIKLLLDPDQETPLYVPASNTKAELQKIGKPAVEVAADFIGAIYKHAMSKIEAKIPKDYLQLCQRKFVLTVPAVWSDKAKNTTLNAAKRAGIQPITLIKEPEAAALYTLHVLKDKSLSIGDAFVLCDAGGGTVDLISYEITKLSPQLELKELVPGKGGLAGSLMLNKRFEQVVKDIVGEDQFVTLRKTKGFRLAMEQFDVSIKTAFRSVDEEYFVNFPMANLKDDPANNIQSNCFNLKGFGDNPVKWRGTMLMACRDVLKGIFAPLITNIQSLVDEQVNLVTIKRLSEGHPKAKEIKAIFLVGGFGSSDYLKNCLQNKHPDIQVIQPHDAWSAIVKGAVLSQLPQEAVITSSVATRHYGVAARAPYNAHEDKGQPILLDLRTGKEKVKKMTWFIYQGEDLERDQTIVHSFFRSIPQNYNESDLMFTDELVQCETIRPAPYPKDGVTKVNCSMKADLRHIPKSHFKEKTAIDGQTYYDISYNLVITTKTAIMKFSLEISGQEMGSVEAKYD